ncbi:MAG: hypothetical protein CVV27_16955, partial [Candidatus Melainabacteria bacterium HGW-Melainabacteria-1]
WARYTGPANSGIQQVLSHDNGSYDRSLGIDSRGGGGRSWSAFAGSAGVLGLQQPIVANKWVFLAVVYDQSAKTAKLYVDGVMKEKTNAESGKGHPYLYIGASPSYGEHFIGDIDEVRIYNQALRESQLQSISTWYGYKTDAAD